MAKPTHSKRDVVVPCRYLDHPKPTHRYKASRTIDTEAVDNVVATLVSMGHESDRSLYLQPPPPTKEPGATPQLVPLKRKLTSRTRLVVGSRPALYEDPTANTRTRKRSEHELEHPFHEVWLPKFDMIRRNVITVSEEVKAQFAPEFRNRSHVEVLQRQGSRYTRLADGPKLPRGTRTCGFLLNRRNFYKGAALTSFFAMDGVAGLILSLLIGERHPEWLEEPGFRMVEMIGTHIPGHNEDLAFIDDWQIFTLAHLPE